MGLIDVSASSGTAVCEQPESWSSSSTTAHNCRRSRCAAESSNANNPTVGALGLIGLSYRTAPLELRGRASITQDRATEFLRLLHKHDVKEGMVLSTCNRTEIYFAGGDVELILSILARFIDTSVEELRPHIYTKRAICAACHLFRVASGMDSAVLGETEIVAQVKQAWRLSQELGCAGPTLALMLQRSLITSKRIRTETELCRGVTSSATLAIHRSEELLGTLEGKHALILGAGQIAERVVKEIHIYRPDSLRVLNRTAEKAVALGTRYGGDGGPLDLLESALAEADVVFTAVSTSKPLIDQSLVESVQSKREDRPLVLIDLGVPANIELQNPPDGVTLVDIDTLSRICSANAERRASAVPQALDILDEETNRLQSDLITRSASPTIRALVAQAENIRRLNLDWAMERLSGLTEREQKIVEDLSLKIVNGLLLAPIQGLKSELVAPEHREVVCKLFRLDEGDAEDED